MITNNVKNEGQLRTLSPFSPMLLILMKCLLALMTWNAPLTFAFTNNDTLLPQMSDKRGASDLQQTTRSDPPPRAIIKSTSVSESEFRAFIRAELALTYASHQLDRLKGSSRPIHIESLLKKSQAEFLSPNPLSAMKTYQKVIDHIHAFDWNEEERKNIFYMLFRAAQLEDQLEKKKLFLQEALVFGQDLKLDFTLFPPPLVKIYLDIKKNTALVPLDLKKVFPSHDLILINGKVYSVNQTVLLPYGTYRVTAFSSAYAAWSKTIALSRLVSQVVHTNPLVKKGNCKAGALLNAVPKEDQKNIWILFPNFCTWNAKNKVIKKYFNAMDRGQEEKLSKANPFINKWNKKKVLKWTAIGSGIFIGAMLLLNKQSKGERSEKERAIQRDKRHQPAIQPMIKVGF